MEGRLSHRRKHRLRNYYFHSCSLPLSKPWIHYIDLYILSINALEYSRSLKHLKVKSNRRVLLIENMARALHVAIIGANDCFADHTKDRYTEDNRKD